MIQIVVPITPMATPLTKCEGKRRPVITRAQKRDIAAPMTGAPINPAAYPPANTTPAIGPNANALTSIIPLSATPSPIPKKAPAPPPMANASTKSY